MIMILCLENLCGAIIALCQDIYLRTLKILLSFFQLAFDFNLKKKERAVARRKCASQN